ncbi:MAG TPA: fibronectin type III domain-containing protein, partial [Methanomassiliicoccales archaeon]|nr:fibronectin type III domain-containing protein [Methanomassiliicoccales archaeon]
LTAIPGDMLNLLNWTAPADNGGSRITRFDVYRSTTADGVFVLVGSTVLLNYTDMGLTNGEAYWYKISCVNAAGEGDTTLPLAATPHHAPDPTTGLTIIPGNARAILSWTGPITTSGAPVSSYKVYRSTTSDGPFVVIASTTALNFTDTGVANGGTYYYRVSALNSIGESAQGSTVSVSLASDNTSLILALGAVAAGALLVSMLYIMRSRRNIK